LRSSVLNLSASGKEFEALLRENFEESYKVMTVEKKFWDFVKELREMIQKLGVKTEGIEIHKRGWELIKP